jgi:hypothetical protein
MSYIAVPAATIEDFLQAKGLERSVYYNEVVYTQTHGDNPNVKIKIYTSIRVGQAAVRACGADSIKIATVYDDGAKRFGVGKFPHVLRVGSEQEVLDRITERMAAAYKRGSEWLSQQQTNAAINHIQPIPADYHDDGRPRGGIMSEEEYAQLTAKRGV